MARPLITSLVPSLLLTVWQALVMPIVLYVYGPLYLLGFLGSNIAHTLRWPN